jgi:hypothetical protein
LERALGVRVARLRRSPVGSSHAVHLATLADGREGVARFATHPDHALARELWATARCRAAAPPGGEGRPERPAPQPDGLVAHLHPALRQEILHVPEAHTEPVVQPHSGR